VVAGDDAAGFEGRSHPRGLTEANGPGNELVPELVPGA
jgi:hypothetical protein